jgi:cellulose synthase/poly-beta-1,6-N-acetylglucosamine synthase-like glycosyltransferase
LKDRLWFHTLTPSGAEFALLPSASEMLLCRLLQASTVATAIQSALEQTWPDKEIIVVNDGSTDRSADICKSFGSRILFVQQPN